jgi:dTDP-4-dehydrorhamnose 3,5-epimerase
MRILEVRLLAIPELVVVRFGRFHDDRGYFAETFRRSAAATHGAATLLSELDFPQMNESYSHAGAIRGLHFQWNPFMGKLVRTVSGRMVDLALDIRVCSPTLGKIVAYELPATHDAPWTEWIWVPPGFAHGNYFTEDTVIEYLCTGEYSPGCEAGVSPLAADLDWSLCDSRLRDEYRALLGANPTISDKDRDGFSVASWLADDRSSGFRYSELSGEPA